MFEGHSIYRMLSDNDVDSIDDSDNAKDLVELWLGSQEVIRCKGCGCLYLWDPSANLYEKYVKVGL
ncbi:hypothetical protein M2404_001901 [Rheinheimera pacifica]|nr:hypothetical protein [Rheinheimera pacifica]